MKIKAERLQELLRPNGFELIWQCGIEKTICFARQSPVIGVFERAMAVTVGRVGEEVALAEVQASLLRGRAFHKDLIERQVLTEFGPAEKRGTVEQYLTPVSTQMQAQEWEYEFSKLVPSFAVALADAKGPELLKKTVTIRKAVERYLGFLPPSDGLEAIRSKLTLKTTDEQRMNAERLSDVSLMIPDGELIYDVAALLVVIYAPEVEDKGDKLELVDPWSDFGSMSRIQLIADFLTTKYQLPMSS